MINPLGDNGSRRSLFAEFVLFWGYTSFVRGLLSPGAGVRRYDTELSTDAERAAGKRTVRVLPEDRATSRQARCRARLIHASTSEASSWSLFSCPCASLASADIFLLLPQAGDVLGLNQEVVHKTWCIFPRNPPPPYTSRQLNEQRQHYSTIVSVEADACESAGVRICCWDSPTKH